MLNFLVIQSVYKVPTCVDDEDNSDAELLAMNEIRLFVIMVMIQRMNEI